MFALEGVVVVDFGQYLAGPFAPMILADLGAEVIKVEPIRGDGMRGASKPFVGCQRGKRDIALDLKHPDGLEIALRLIERADVVHHNMTKGVADRLGIGYDAAKARNPDVVYCNTWAYGQEGPLSDFGGLDPLYQAIAGLEHEAGPVREGNPPLYLRFGMCDTANAFLSVVAVLVALYHRCRTGEGQKVWTSLLNGGALFGSEVFLAHDATVARPRLDRDQTGVHALYRLYRTRDGWLQLAAVRDVHWGPLCRVLGIGAPASDVRFATAEGRADHRSELEAVLAPVFATRTSRQWWLALDAAGVPCEIPVDTNEGEAVLHDDDNVRLGLVASYPHPVLGGLRQFGHLIGFSETPGRIAGPPPMLGEHTLEILAWLGYDDATVDGLREAGVVYHPDGDYRWPC